MSVNIDLTSISNTEPANNSHIQYIPCDIEYNGEAALEKYFTKYVTEKSSVNDDGQEEKSLSAMFRGYPLTGTVLPVPEGYTGIVVKETRPGLNSEEMRTMKGTCQFKEFTFWNWDRKPSRGDKYQQAMDWAAISNVIHNEN